MLAGCTVFVEDSGETLQLGVDEGYTLLIPASSSTADGDIWAELHAHSVWGALHGLETFVQMVQLDSFAALEQGQGRITGVPIAIADNPRFPHRGLLIDTSRHFLPVSVLFQHIDAMAASKLNVLHWHVVDGQAFPFNSSVHPLLSLLGSYDPQRATYSLDDARAVVQHAYERGVRVVAEFDMPAHTGSWFFGYPWLQGSAVGVMDPTLESTYTFIDALVGELSTVFIDDVLHLGCDELTLSQWNTTTIQQWMAAHNVSSLPGLESYWLQRIDAIGRAHGKSIITWHDPYANGAAVPKDIALEVWGGDLSYAQSIAAAGYKVIFAAPFYLDNVGKQWPDFYAEFFPAAADARVEDLILGGETCMWGEWVDSTNAISRVWPRAAAVAEVLWAPTDGSNARLAPLSALRMAHWRCRMLLRGIGAEPSSYGGPFYCGPDPITVAGRQQA